MRVFTPILAGLWISLFCLSGCGGINRAESLRMLDRRAEYEDQDSAKLVPAPGLKDQGPEESGSIPSGPIPIRSRPKVASIWIHPHEMASRDYFWGGWMSVVVEPDQWVLSKPGAPPEPLPDFGTSTKNKSR